MRAWSSRVMAPLGPRFRVEKSASTCRLHLERVARRRSTSHALFLAQRQRRSLVSCTSRGSPSYHGDRSCRRGAQVNGRQPVELKIKGDNRRSDIDPSTGGQKR